MGARRPRSRPQQAPPLDVATDAPVELRATGSANLPGAVSAPIDVAGPELDEPPPTERHAVDVLPSPTGLLRGQVVDARTGQGLPFVEVAPYSLGQKPSSSVQADGEGRFELQTSMGAEHFAFARDRLTGKRLARRKVDTLFSKVASGAWTWARP